MSLFGGKPPLKYPKVGAAFAGPADSYRVNGWSFGEVNQNGISVRTYVSQQKKPSVELWPPATELRSRTIAKQTSKKIEELCQAKTTEMLTPYEKELTTTFWDTLTENERRRLCLILGLPLGDASPNFHLSNEESCAEFSKKMNDAREARVLQGGLEK